MKQGAYYEFPESDYHADPCIAPSLSASIIKPLLYQSPRHAAFYHPKLNPDFVPEDNKRFDTGKAAHALILRDKKDFEIIDAADWRTNAAKEKRDAAYNDKKIPLLTHQWQEINAMVDSAREQLLSHECCDAFVLGGASEVTLIWQEGDIWCRCRIDYISPDGKFFYDYKTTEATANPDTVDRLFSNMSYDITDAFYRRGISRVLGIEHPVYRFVVQEVEKPNLLSVIGFTPEAQGVADRKVDEAIRIWSECLKNNIWPGYPARTCYIGLPVYAEKAWLEREAREVDPSLSEKIMLSMQY